MRYMNVPSGSRPISSRVGDTAGMGTIDRQNNSQAASSDALSDTLTATAFLNVAGHELRAPVTALKGQLQLMQRRIRKEGGRARDDEALTKMLYQIYSMRGQLSLMRQRANLVPMIEHIIALYAVGSGK